MNQDKKGKAIAIFFLVLASFTVLLAVVLLFNQGSQELRGSEIAQSALVKEECDTLCNVKTFLTNFFTDTGGEEIMVESGRREIISEKTVSHSKEKGVVEKEDTEVAPEEEMAPPESVPSEEEEVPVDEPTPPIEETGLGLSEGLGILAAPSIDTIAINTTNPTTNNTYQNVTAHVTTSDGDSDPVKVIYNWFLNDSSILLLNLPFEKNATGTNTRDYSPFGNDGAVTSATWNASGGYDAKGAYEFDGVNDYITINDHDSIDIGTGDFSISFWIIKPPAEGSFAIVYKLDGGSNGYRVVSKSNHSLRFTIFDDGWSNYCTGDTGGFDDGLWHHYAVSVDRDGMTEIYLDGSSAGSVDCSGVPGTLATTADLQIGWNANSDYFNGTIDELMIFNRTLSADQILALYENRTDTISSQETSIDDRWNFSATPNDGTSDGTTAFSNNLTVLDSSPSVTELVLNTTDVSTNDTTTNLTAYATTSDPNGDSVKVIYNWYRNDSSLLLLNMPFEKNATGTNTRDYSPFGNDGTENGGVSWNATGGYDSKGAYEFDGVDDYITINDSDSIDIGTDDFTISFWIMKPPAEGSFAIVYKLDGGSNGYRVVSKSNHSLRFTIFDDGWDNYCTDDTSGFDDGLWHHYAVSADRDGMTKIYLDGSSAGSVDCSGVPGTLATTTDLQIGWDANSNYFNGTIDDLTIWNLSLSPEQIAAIYSSRPDILAAQETVGSDYWNVSATPNDGTEDGTTVFSNNVTISATFVPVTQTENDGPESTNLSSYNETAITSVENFTWHKSNKGKIQWKVPLDLSTSNIGNDADLSNDIEVGEGFITVDSGSAAAFRNVAASVTFENVECSLCNVDDIVYSTGSTFSLAEIQADGESCRLSGKCDNFTCTSASGEGNCTFDVTGFSGFAAGGNANLTINDSAEGTSVYANTAADFFAYYVNSTDGEAIASAECNITFDDDTGPFEMTWNGTGDDGYNYTKSGGFETAAMHTWNVTCIKTGWTTLFAEDTISIVADASVPEFSDYALILILVTVVGGFFAVKKKEKEGT